MVETVQRLSDQLLSMVVPRTTAAACQRKLFSRSCVACPGTNNYLFRTREIWCGCTVLTACTRYYSSCNRTC